MHQYNTDLKTRVMLLIMQKMFQLFNHHTNDMLNMVLTSLLKMLLRLEH